MTTFRLEEELALAPRSASTGFIPALAIHSPALVD